MREDVFLSVALFFALSQTTPYEIKQILCTFP